MFSLPGLSAPAGSAQPDDPSLVLVLGASGTETYATQFQEWADAWKGLADSQDLPLTVIGSAEASPPLDKHRLKDLLQSETNRIASPLWIVMIGHGTFDGREAKFNLRGPDVSASEMKAWLDGITRPVVVLNTASASGPFIHALSHTNRVIITATRSGDESNFARFGRFLSRAIGQPSADLDQDGQTSLLEAFLKSAREVEDFYEFEGRLATEHALIDDTGDGLGTPATWFRGVRAVKKAADGSLPDGLRAHQIHLVPSELERRMPKPLRQRRDGLELQIASLRERKTDMDETAYYEALEALLVDLAEVYQQAEQAPGPFRRGR